MPAILPRGDETICISESSNTRGDFYSICLCTVCTPVHHQHHFKICAKFISVLYILCKGWGRCQRTSEIQKWHHSFIHSLHHFEMCVKVISFRYWSKSSLRGLNPGVNYYLVKSRISGAHKALPDAIVFCKPGRFGTGTWLRFRAFPLTYM